MLSCKRFDKFLKGAALFSKSHQSTKHSNMPNATNPLFSTHRVASLDGRKSAYSAVSVCLRFETKEMKQFGLYSFMLPNPHAVHVDC